MLVKWLKPLSQKEVFLNLMIKDFIFQMELSLCHLTIHFWQKQINLNKNRPKYWKIFLGREIIFAPFRKNCIKKPPYTVSVPSNFNVCSKNFQKSKKRFQKQIKTLLKRNTKDIMKRIMKRIIPMIQNLKETF